jgi:hypothetical protein
MAITRTTPPKEVIAVPGHDNLSLCIYGKLVAKNLSEALEQAFYVSLNGSAIARGELAEDQQAAVEDLLVHRYPQHSQIIGLTPAST